MLHDRAEAYLGDWTRHIYRWRWWVIALSLLITAGLGSGVASIEGDFSSDSYLLPGDDTRQRYDAFRDRFGLDDHIVVALEPDQVFDLAFLEKLRSLHRELERELPHVEEVLSLLNARHTWGKEGELVVEDLLERWPQSEADLRSLAETVLSNPAYTNLLISEDARFTVILIQPVTYSSLEDPDEGLEGFDANDAGKGPLEAAAYLSTQEANELTDRLYEIVDRHRSDELSIHLGGEQIIGHRAAAIGFHDGFVFTVLSLVVMLGVLVLLFRRIGGALLSLLVVGLSIVSTFGVMGFLGIPFSHPTPVIPSFLIAVGICDSVHILTIYYQALGRGKDREQALIGAFQHSGLAVIMTSLTTAGGVASFVAAEIAPVAHLGILAPIGVLFALAYTMTLLPALLAVVPTSGHSPLARAPGVFDATIVGIGDSAARHPRRVLIAVGLLTLLATSGIARIRFSHDPLSWLLADDPVQIAVARIDQALRGTSTVEILIDTGEENGLYEPDSLRRIEAAARDAKAIDEGPVRVGQTSSIVDIVKETNRALNENRSEFYRVPDDRRLIAQELLLFENSGSEDLEKVTDSGLQLARLTLRVPLVDGFYYGPFLENLSRDLRRTLGDDLRFELTGATVLGSRAFSVVLTSMARSYGLALLIITPLMILLIGRVRLGLLSMIPNLLPVYFTLALMGWLDIPISMSTVLVGSIVIGVAVDDTIHFFHRFDRYQRASGDAQRAVHETLATTGRALFVTSLVLALSFGIYSFGNMTGTRFVGTVAPFAVISAFLADLLLSPAIVVLATRGQPGKG